MKIKRAHGEKFAVGLDVGTTKICAVVGSVRGGRTTIESLSTAPSLGLRKGIVVDSNVTAESIRSVVREAERSVGRQLSSVFVGIAGGHIKGFEGYGAVDIRSGVVSEEDITVLMESAGAVYVPVDREILHVIPAGFRLDGRNGIKDPLGLSGRRLESRPHIITGSVTPVRNLIQCCETAGLTVTDIVLEPLASADAVLSPEERVEGVALVDIGGGTTDIAVYSDGLLRMTAVLALGGNHITNDIAIGLGITTAEGEEVKKRYGVAMKGIVDGVERVITDLPGIRKMRITRGQLTEIIQPRSEEIMALVKREIINLTSSPVSSVVLTGGASLLEGMQALAEVVFDLPVRIGRPDSVINGDRVNSPEYATGVGLVHFGLRYHENQHGTGCEESLTGGGIFERMKEWAKEFVK